MKKSQAPDSNTPRMGDLGPFVRIVEQKTGLTMIVPEEPPKNSFGFILPPMDYDPQPHEHHGKSCPTCHFELPTGGRDQHHSYWPRTPDLRSKRKSHTTRFPDTPDYRSGYAKQLRSATFAISRPICRPWHETLHDHQRYPTEADLPRDSIVQIALSQFELYSGSVDITAALQADNQSKQEALNSRGEAILETLGTQREFVFPSQAYYAMTSLNEERLIDEPLPVVYDLSNVLIGLEEALTQSRQ